jgi:hypothetical protein
MTIDIENNIGEIYTHIGLSETSAVSNHSSIPVTLSITNKFSLKEYTCSSYMLVSSTYEQCFLVFMNGGITPEPTPQVTPYITPYGSAVDINDYKGKNILKIYNSNGDLIFENDIYIIIKNDMSEITPMVYNLTPFNITPFAITPNVVKSYKIK